MPGPLMAQDHNSRFSSPDLTVLGNEHQSLQKQQTPIWSFFAFILRGREGLGGGGGHFPVL